MEPSNGCIQQSSEINNLNAKLAYDAAAQLQHQSQVDNQSDSRAWGALRLLIAHNTEAFSHTVRMASATAGQTGQTENQQTVTPIRTGAGDYLASGSIPANRATDVAAAGVATANQSIADALATAVALFNQGIAALQAVTLAATGNAAK